MDIQSVDSIDLIVDSFVEKVNSIYREPVLASDSTASIMVGIPDEYGFSDWHIKPYSHVDWIELIEQRINQKLPYALRSLVTRYIFPGFEAAGLFFFANTPEGTDFYELRTRLFQDKLLYKVLIENGFLQFAISDSGNYDPICFDLNKGSAVDRPIVRIDHEYVLCDSVIKVNEDISPSLIDILSQFSR